MVKSYRGKEIDMVSLAKKNDKTVALGNAHMNGRGDILGNGGKIVKSREEQLKEYYEGNKLTEEVINLKDDSVKKVEDELTTINQENDKKSSKKIYTDITEDEKKELEKIKGKIK